MSPGAPLQPAGPDVRRVEDVNPILPEFWVRPPADIEADLALLRAEPGLVFRSEPPVPETAPIVRGPGYFPVVRHADVLVASKHPELFSSAAGITILDSPPGFNEYFGSMIAMDDPRHARLRRLVSAGFTPHMLGRLERSVERIAAEIVAGVAPRGEIDFVVDVAAALPLRIICDMMGIPASQYRYVFDRTNIILGAVRPRVRGRPQRHPRGDAAGRRRARRAHDRRGDPRRRAVRRPHRGRRRRTHDDLTTALMAAEVDGDRLSHADLASFFILLVAAGNETTRNAISWGLKLLTDHPDQRALWAADVEGVAPTAVEEIVRLASPVTYMRRTVTGDTELCGNAAAAGRQALPLLPRRQPRRVGLPRPAALRRAAATEPPRRLRWSRAPLLPRCPPGPAGDHRHVPGAVPPPPRHRGRRRTPAAAVLVHPRGQAPVGPLHADGDQPLSFRASAGRLTSESWGSGARSRS